MLSVNFISYRSAHDLATKRKALPLHSGGMRLTILYANCSISIFMRGLNINLFFHIMVWKFPSWIKVMTYEVVEKAIQEVVLIRCRYLTKIQYFLNKFHSPFERFFSSRKGETGKLNVHASTLKKVPVAGHKLFYYHTNWATDTSQFMNKFSITIESWFYWLL